MALPPFATFDELTARIPGGVADADVDRAEAVLADASTLIRNVAGQDWATEDEIDFGDMAERQQDDIVRICLAASKRAFLTPTGVRSETVGDASQNYADGAGEVYLTDDEKGAIKAAASGSTSSGFGVVELEIGTPGWSGDYIAVAGQDEPLPFSYEPLRP